MQEPSCRENYPPSTVIASNLLTLVIYGIGIYLIWQSGAVFALAYLALILALEIRLIRSHCVDCYYYGKTCAFGKGRLSALLFPRGSPERFTGMTVTARDLIPDLLVIVLPVLAGVLLLVQGFSWTILALVAALLILGFPGTAFVRGQLACRFCRQRELGCPAEQLFAQGREK